ncbi:MAG: 16S rRNA (cytosine(967)-C(5))-methyltransferase RsmB [Myxococcota bacterium]|nr:16S rRNA (cytosine(967)-C(5))-methyltransferase [Deltaproteobacteria bacterium]MCP4241384.1 16S rRNA (cytosine(967)-C(5))-methyltransferase RsmB [bacterium]MDP6074283.1 16S rRNA (cytosine(967)-C(5))-methyltransferase RsmB [Myxococcota bacterium]MDP6241753.1 16S rRNA (cytosine(967)-C(5))-methyltransferase RsmB [Myxococcota bacterium]MDP7074611.1 16S rRNA (cytosine(967)-C(5))-methyltransferase RsmB [Myxococcota bacterium]
MGTIRSRRARPRRGRPRRPGGAGRAAPTQARLLALRVLERVERTSSYADRLLHAQLGHSRLNAADRAFATDLVNGTLRWRGRLDFLLAQLVERDLEKLEPMLTNALRIGAYQIVCNDRVPDRAAVDQTVRSVRAAGAEHATGFVNAVLRRLAAEHRDMRLPSLETDPLGHLTHALSLPAWLADRWLEQFGPVEAIALAEACNRVPPLCVRANRQRTTRDALLTELRTRFPGAMPCHFAGDGVVLGHRGHPGLDPAFLGGRFTVQDEASQLVVAFLDPQPGERVLDVCSAPGGKATGIAERMGPGGEVVALDRNSRRLDLVRRHVRRLGLSDVRCIERDATQALDNLTPTPGFDRVLVDAPCSGLGTLRRNPDARWRVRPDDPARLAEVQRTLLLSAAAALRPGGVLVYSTCTVLPEENENLVRSFLAEAPGFRRAPTEEVAPELHPLLDAEGTLRVMPHIHDGDGFFAVRMVRVS